MTAVPDFAGAKQKARTQRAFWLLAVSAAVMTMVIIAAGTAAVRFQLDVGNTGGHIQPGLALHAERLQRIGVRRTADQEVAAAADPYRCIGADAAIISGEIAVSDPCVRRVHRP